MDLHKKHLATSLELDELKKKFNRVFATNCSTWNKIDLDYELLRSKTLAEIIFAIYEYNDFVASSYAYQYLVPHIDNIIKYIHTRIKTDSMKHWCEKKSKTTTIRDIKTGEMAEYSNLNYLYEYLKPRLTAIAGRYFIHYNIIYLESIKSDKKYPRRQRILESFIWWVNQGLLNIFDLKMPSDNGKYDFVPEQIIFSTFPSSGKSFVCNATNEMFAILGSIIKGVGGCLRVGNEQGNIFRQSRQTIGMISNEIIWDIYPELKDYINSKSGVYRPFAKESEEEWGLEGVYFDPATCIFKTRDSSINSVRCLIGMMDDPSRGFQECNNIEIHKKINNLYVTDFDDRFDGQERKLKILTGTMFNPFDVFATQIESALKHGYFKDDRFRGTYISKDKKTVVILNDVFEEKKRGNGIELVSAYPEFISTEAALKKQDDMEAYNFACTWRQKPIPAEGLLFDYELLQQYDELKNEELSECSFAYIDPTRKSGGDYFAMPILKRNNLTGKYPLIGAIFQRKSGKDLIDEIVKTIIDYNIIKIVIESNVSADLADRILDKLKEKGIIWCEIVNIYNTVNKAQRIADLEGTVKRYIEFPKKEKYSTKTQLGHFIYSLTGYSLIKTNKNDDAPDGLCGFCQHFIVKTDIRNIIKTQRKLPI